MPPSRSRSVRVPGLRSLRWLLVAGLSLFGCNPGTTPGFPTPDFQAPLDTPFPMRAGDLALVAQAGQFLYLSVQSIGLDSRCPPGSTCDEPGFVELFLELETAESQGATRFQVPPNGNAVATFQGFEIRVLEAQPPGSGSRIPPTDYIFLMTVSLR